MHRTKLWLDRQLNIDSWDQSGLSPLNKLVFLFIFLSVVLFTVETEPGIYLHWGPIIDAMNAVILVSFAAEFSLRIWSAGETLGIHGLSGRTRYAGRAWLSIDFLAFGPELIVMALVLSGAAIPVSLGGFKAIRLLRVLKLARFIPGGRMVVEVVQSVWHYLLASLVAAVTLIYLSAVMIYLAERTADPENFGSVFRSLWWSVVTLTTVGYGDVYPQTVFGKITAGIIVILGVGIIALPSGIIAGAFVDKLRERRESLK